MKLDLGEIEKKARAATLGPWRTESTRGDRWHVVRPGGFPVGRGPDGGPANFDSHTASHIAANSPPVTLALIAHIRELEDDAERHRALSDAAEQAIAVHGYQAHQAAKLIDELKAEIRRRGEVRPPEDGGSDDWVAMRGDQLRIRELERALHEALNYWSSDMPDYDERRVAIRKILEKGTVTR